MKGELERIFENKRILVTGGTGSIGSEIVRQLLHYNPKVIRIFSDDENGIFNMHQEMKSQRNLRFLLGSIREKDRLKRAIEDIDIVFHAAALKHVPICEYNPFEAVKTNVIGTQNLVEVSIDKEVEKLIAITTDKAVNPINTMGATKLLSEKLVIDANFYKGMRKTIFSCVRFGNVMNSRGSVIPIFEEQIRKGGPVTITDPKMTRFIMSLSQSVGLVLKATAVAKGGEIFVLKMPVLRITDLAKVMVEEIAPKYGYKPEGIKIETMGIRSGEKFYESLMTEEEAKNALQSEDMFIVLPQVNASFVGNKDNIYPGAKPVQLMIADSRREKPLSVEEIRKLLYAEEILK